MSTGPLHEMAISYDPSALRTKLAKRRRLVRSRLISLAITIVIMVAIYFWRRDQLGGAGFFAVYGVVLVLSLAFLIVAVILHRRVKRSFVTIGTGTAIRIAAVGIQVAGVGVRWPEVARLDTVKGRLGQSPEFRLITTDGRTGLVPLDQVVVYPATLDSTARAFSGGRHGVDLEALDN